jgi:Na+/melibiose symporter-like transporter
MARTTPTQTTPISSEQTPSAQGPATQAAQTPPTQTRPLERVSFWTYFTGQSMLNSLLTSFIATYMMLNGIRLTGIAVAMVAVKVWDLVNDSFFGIIFDRIKFKSGRRSIPWLRLAMIILPVVTVLVFSIPSALSPAWKLVWFVISYIMWDSAFTLSDVPIYNLVTMMTTNLNERNSLLSVARLFALIGAFITGMAAPLLVSEQVGFSFGQAALLIAFLAFITMVPIAIRGKERVHQQNSDQRYSIKQIISYVRTNKYLSRYYAGYIISGIALTNAPLDLFVSYFLFGSALFSSLALIIASVPIGLMSLLMGPILKHVDKFKLFYWSNVAFAVLGVAVYLGGWHSAVVYLILLGLRSFPQGIVLTLNLTFTPDIVEYGHYVTGTDARGITFAFQSFAAKVITLAQPLALTILGLFPWQATEANSFAELAARHITQTPAALNGLWITATVIPVVGTLIALIPYSLYHLTDHDVQLMARANAGEISRETADNLLSPAFKKRENHG